MSEKLDRLFMDLSLPADGDQRVQAIVGKEDVGVLVLRCSLARPVGVEVLVVVQCPPPLARGAVLLAGVSQVVAAFEPDVLGDAVLRGELEGAGTQATRVLRGEVKLP